MISDAVPGSRAAFALGAFDVDDDATTAGEGRIEWRGVFAFPALRPLAGVMATSDGAAYGFVGLYLDFEMFERIVVTPSAAAGLYAQGGGRDLGNVVEFRTQIEVAYRLTNAGRIGLAFSHMSNAGLGTDNPGSESVVVSYALPLSSLLPQ